MEPQLVMNPKKMTDQEPCTLAARQRLSFTSKGRQRGMALVIVLAVLVLLSGLVVAFFSSVTSDASSSAVYSNDVGAKQLAESAVNLVMGQIVAATNNSTSAWASQPGAIRTYTSTGNTTAQVFKLYSAQSMVQTGSGNLSSDVVSTWATDRAHFTDLNAPVTDTSGQVVYPIVDPTPTVEGFSISGAPTAPSGNAAPMPVRWLYMLKDGTLAAATGNATTATVSSATAANPIVGRIAFWTDDETSKVNINTASDGAFWDVPRLNSPQDRAYGSNQTIMKEFQRYPGHPAMTSLAPVFFASSANSTPTLTNAQRDALYSVAPRIVAGGSKGGSVDTTANLTVTASTPMSLDSDRLYASVDELMFTVNSTAVNRTTQNASDTNITANAVRQRAFFLTASSRAPETTIFNTPRISMWPITLPRSGVTGNRTTAYDELIRFCSTINGKPYYFQRQDAKSPTNDWANIPRNQELLKYLQTLSKKDIPGFGSKLESKTSDTDRDQLLVEMLDYIRSTNLYDDNLSSASYGTDVAADKAPQFTSGRKPTGADGRTYAWNGHGVVAPLRVPAGLNSGTASTADTLMGFGRFHTISEAALLFICNADGASGNFTAPRVTVTVAGTNSTQTLTNLVPTFSLNSTAWTLGSNNSTIQLTGLNCTVTGSTANLTLTSNNSTTPVATINPINTTTGNLTSGSNATLTISTEQFAQMISNNTANCTVRYYLDQSDNQTGANTAIPKVFLRQGTATYPANKMLGGTALASTEKRIQMMLFFDNFSPMGGYTQYMMDGSVDVTFPASFQIDTKPLSLSGTKTINFNFACNFGGAHVDGYWGYRKGLASRKVEGQDLGVTDENKYGLVSAPLTISNNSTMAFTGGNVTVDFYSRPTWPATRERGAGTADLVQTINLNFPSANFPTPILKTFGTMKLAGGNITTGISTTMEDWWSLNSDGVFANKPSGPSALESAYTRSSTIGDSSTKGRLSHVSLSPAQGPGSLVQWSDTLRTLVPYHGDTRLIAGAHIVPSGVFKPSTFYYNATRGGNATNALAYGVSPSLTANATYTFPQIQSYISLSSNAFAAHYRPVNATERLVSGANYISSAWPKFSGFVPNAAAANISARTYQQWGDFDTNMGTSTDGPFINKPDEGTAYTEMESWGRSIPYIDNSFGHDAYPSYFSPNRQVPSAGMFGSLPTRMRTGNVDYPGATSTSTWRTLLLRPQEHPGASNPPDHLWTDFFWMPVVEPYAISEPFSTAGKINMNYAIAPFNYIERKTGMVALLRGEKILAIQTSTANTYKNRNTATGAPTVADSRFDLNIQETLTQWDNKFASNELFVSPSQICDQHLVPVGQTISGMSSTNSTYWTTNALTGDNARERPYTNLLGRLTTKSNCFTVHYRVQVLKKSPSTSPTDWVEGRDVIASEYRGSTLIERFIDPNNPAIPDFATDPSATIDSYYRFRVVQARRFAP